MTEISVYELAAWEDIKRFKGRPLSRAMRESSTRVATGAAELGKRATKYIEDRPRAKAALSRGQGAMVKGTQTIGAGARKAADSLPEGMVNFGGAAVGAMQQTVARAARAGLSPNRVVARHQKRGHDVRSLFELRHLDLEQIDAVRGRGASLYYPITAAASGAAAGLVISGGELAISITAGAAAAPSGAAIASAFVGDAAFVLGLASRYVGRVSLFYGYDPEEPGEKLFVLSVVNAGTAVSAGAKNAAMADVSRLTQALFRRKTWEILDKSLVAQVSQQFAKRFSIRLTKQSLGKVVPAAGIALGGAFNWATLESIVDAADIAYRRRFLLEKYPHLADEEVHESFPDVVANGDDEMISVLDELGEVGGPDLR